jgi:hypothetical protein
VGRLLGGGDRQRRLLADFGAHDATVMRYSLVTDIGIPVLLLLAAPSFFAGPPVTAG